MYDKILEELTKESEALNGKILAALADGKTELHTSLKKEKDVVQKKIRGREKVVQEKSKDDQKNRIAEENRILTERLQKSRKDLVALDCSNETIEVFQGYNTEKLKFSYGDLLKKMNTILKQKKSFSVGNQYDGKLDVKSMKGKVVFNYYFSNRDEYEFVLEVLNTDTLEQFMKTLTLISCKHNPEIEHGVGHPPITESWFLYRGNMIISDLFNSFAKALYRKEN